MLPLGINEFHLTHEAHSECRLGKPVHFSILKKESIGVGTARDIELNPLEAVDGRHNFLGSWNLST
ncbi:hypothetical protein SALBM311S_06636 [Streptomyces alboniger]